MNTLTSSENTRRILGRVARHEFVGRATELDRLLSQTRPAKSGRGLLLLMEPSAGVSELLRQAFDQIFNERSEVIPVYFAFTRHETTAVSAAIEFLNGFLQQYIAFRRNEPALCKAALTLQDMVELAPPSDLEWIDQLVQLYAKVRFSNDNKELVRFCLSAPQRVPTSAGRPFVMLDGSELAEDLNNGVILGTELLRVFGRSNLAFVLAGLRRQILNAAHDAECDFERIDLLRLKQLSVEEANLLVEHVARRQQVPTTQEARDLLVQQFSGSPLFINSFLQAAHEKNTALVTYLDCERLYADELLGGHLRHHFDELLEEMAPQLETRMTLIRLLWEAAASEEKSVTVEAWRKRMRGSAHDLEEILRLLHIHEFVNWNGPTIDATTGSQTWKDYLKVNYRLSVRNEARALVVADAIADSLKRAPHTMARHYRQLGKVGLRQVLTEFDCQHVPKILFDYSTFANKYKGTSDEQLIAGLKTETELLKVPQTVHVASCFSFNSDFRQLCEEDKCVVGHAFEDGAYNDAHETVWLVAEIDAKLEVDLETTVLWFERLDSLATTLGFRRYQVWLISTEGFTNEACSFLQRKSVFSSSQRQLEMLTDQIGEGRSLQPRPIDEPDEFLMVVPMGEDNELLAASTVEQVARRLPFQPAAINQIKTAIIEACINASEHSHSPDQKIYQRFRVESDKLVITISSRGVVPTNVGSLNSSPSNTTSSDAAEERRGWGLKLIRTLMDEVEFERVDEGTSLRMIKYLRSSGG
jgi:serine/threonine-protein kinase RsbW